MIDLADIFQQFKMNELKSENFETRNMQGTIKYDVRSLEDKIDYLSVVMLAMWEMLEEKGYSRMDLVKKIEEVDMRDGVLDGKLAHQKKANVCSDCKRKVNPRHRNCFYCGAKIDSGNFI